MAQYSDINARSACPATHHIAFHTHCRCGWPLILFSQGKRPFQCFACDLDWARLPHLHLPPDRVTLEHHLWALYEFFLLKGTSSLKASALHVALPHIREYEPFELKLSGRQVRRIAEHAQDRLSLRYLVDVLVSVDLSPKDLASSDCSLSEGMQ